MIKYKNFNILPLQSLVGLFCITFAFVMGTIAISSQVLADDAHGCPTGTTYNDKYLECVGKPEGNKCPKGSTLATDLPPPDTCAATAKPPTISTSSTEAGAGKYTCGAGADAVKVSINFGCKGKGNGMTDLTFAIIRFLSAGVGLVVIGSIVFAGVQYTTSQGDPNTTAQAIKRIRNSIYALFIYLFTAAILNFILPAGFLK